MAGSDKDVNIRIGTEADTSGAEKAEEALKKVQEAASNPMSMPDSVMGPERTDEINRQAEATNYLADSVSDAAENVEDLGDKSDEAAPKMDELIGIQRAQAAAQLAQFLGNAARDVRALGNELGAANVKGANMVDNLATGLESVAGAAAGAAQGFAAGGPMGAAIGGLIGLMTGPLRNAVTGMVNDFKALKEAEDNAATAARNLKAAKDAVAAEDRRNGLFEFFERGRQAISNAAAELDRFIKLRDATAAADTAVRQARSTGDTSFQSAASGVEAEFSDRIAKLENEINDARARADLAERRAVKAELDAASAAVNDSTTEADVAQLKAEAKEARSAADQARADAANSVLIAEQQLRALIAEKDAQVHKAFEDVGDEAAARGAQILELVNNASKQGETLTEAQKTAASDLQKILADGTVVQGEQVRFRTDLRTIITSLGNQGKEAAEANTLFQKAVEGMEGNTRTFMEITRNILRRQEQMETTIRDLQEQAKNPSQPR